MALETLYNLILHATAVGELDLCADVSCHDHGTCDTQTGNCTCDESWDPESFCECQVYEAVCTPDACGLMATCVAECNEPVCTCEPGLIPEGPNACRGKESLFGCVPTSCHNSPVFILFFASSLYRDYQESVSSIATYILYSIYNS
jgi:hypothetical protein